MKERPTQFYDFEWNRPEKKPDRTLSDKIQVQQLAPPNPDSLMQWIVLYHRLHVMGAPEKTVTAKTRDLDRFARFFEREIAHDRIDGWTPAVSKAFQHQLESTVSEATGRSLAPTTINRVMATIRHFGSWVHHLRPMLAGSPLAGVRDLQIDEPEWNGLTNREVLRLKSAVEQRLALCTRGDQNPHLEAAVFYTLLHTGLRQFELVSLNVEDYHHKGFHQVRRKARRVTRKVSVPKEAREALDTYLAGRGERSGSDPLLTNRFSRRLDVRDVQRICHRIANQANAQLPEDERFHLTPHMLRHTFLKRIADEYGIHYAQKLSGNTSIREVFRYTAPTIG